MGAVVACDPGGWSPFGPAKWLVVSAFGVVLVAVAVVNVARLTRVEHVLLGGLLGLALLGTATGLDGRYAWLGTPERHLGFVTWGFIAAGYVTGRTVAGVGARRVVARAGSVGAMAIGLWVAAELVSGPPIALVSTTRRLTGPFGSAAYLGAASLGFGFLALGVAIDRWERTPWRIVAGLGGFGCGVALVGSGARAAWLGAAVGIVVLMPRRARRVIVGLAVAVVLLAPRLGDSVDRSAGSSSRLDEWRVAAKVVGHHPLLGVGPEGYRLAFAEGVDDSYERSYGRDVLPDRAHSGPLDVAVTMGVPAAALWLVAVGTVVALGIRTARLDDPIVACAAVAAITYFVQQLLLFPLAELDPFVWGLAGIVVSAVSPLRHARPQPIVTRRFLAGVVTIAVGVVAFAGVKEIAADRFAADAIDALDRGVDAVPAARRAVALRRDVLRYRLVLARAEEASGSLAGTERALAESQQALALSPLDPIARGEEARLLSARAAITGDPGQLAEALRAYRSLVADDPHRPAWQLGLGRAAAAVGEVELARTALERAVFLAPDDPIAADLLDRLG